MRPPLPPQAPVDTYCSNPLPSSCEFDNQDDTSYFLSRTTWLLGTRALKLVVLPYWYVTVYPHPTPAPPSPP